MLDLAGTVALLLWGVHMVQTGVQRAFGAKLRSFMAHQLRNRASAFLAGLGVTALLQSSTATGLMVTGFAAEGLVALVPGLAVMLGGNVGTTLIVQVLAFDVSPLSSFSFSAVRPRGCRCPIEERNSAPAILLMPTNIER